MTGRRYGAACVADVIILLPLVLRTAARQLHKEHLAALGVVRSRLDPGCFLVRVVLI